MELTPLQLAALIIGGWILVAVLGEPLHEVLRRTGNLITTVLTSLAHGLSQAIAAMNRAGNTLQHYSRRFWDAVQPLLEYVGAALANPSRARPHPAPRADTEFRPYAGDSDLEDAPLSSAIDGHLHGVLELLPASSKPPWLHAFGYLMYLVAFLGFGYADVAQAANSRSVMYVGLEVPSFLQDLTVPLLIASAGTAIMLGTIMGDLLAKTDFVPWRTLPRWARGMVGAVVVVTFLFDVALMLLIALVRVTEINAALIPESLAVQLRTYAAFADSLVIIPLLITTFLLFWGLFGVLVAYAIFIHILGLACRLLSFALGLLASACPWLGKGSAAIVAIVFAVVCSALALMKWALEATAVVVERAFELFEAIVDLIKYPLVEPAKGVNRYFRE